MIWDSLPLLTRKHLKTVLLCFIGTTQKWPSSKCGRLIKNLYQATTNKIWSFLVGFSIFSAVNVLKEIKVYLNKDLQFRMSWSHSGRLKMFSVTSDKEVQYNCSVHGFAHLFIIAISRHSHKERKKPQFFSNVTSAKENSWTQNPDRNFWWFLVTSTE